MFRFCCLRFALVARQPIRFPHGTAVNILRGALGTFLRSVPEQYSRIFAPQHLDTRSGYVDAPRPFVFRAAHLDGITIESDAEFYFDIHVFDQGSIPGIECAFAKLAEEGLGRARSPVEILRIECRERELPLEPPVHKIARLRINFLTPTELKSAGVVADSPDFHILLPRAAERIANLCRFYGDGRAITLPPVDGVRMTTCRLEQQRTDRFSTRTGQTHSLGGFTGVAEYEGNLTPFLRVLEAAQYTGVGRQTTWGKGQLRVRPLVVDGGDEVV